MLKILAELEHHAAAKNGKKSYEKIQQRQQLHFLSMIRLHICAARPIFLRFTRESGR